MKTDAKVSLAQLEEMLPVILELYEDDLVAASKAGRVLVVMQAPETEIDEYGGFTWAVRDLDLREVAKTMGPGLVACIALCRRVETYPVVLVAEPGSSSDFKRPPTEGASDGDWSQNLNRVSWRIRGVR